MKKKQNTLNCVEITGDTGIALGAISLSGVYVNLIKRRRLRDQDCGF